MFTRTDSTRERSAACCGGDRYIGPLGPARSPSPPRATGRRPDHADRSLRRGGRRGVPAHRRRLAWPGDCRGKCLAVCPGQSHCCRPAGKSPRRGRRPVAGRNDVGAGAVPADVCGAVCRGAGRRGRGAGRPARSERCAAADGGAGGRDGARERRHRGHRPLAERSGGGGRSGARAGGRRRARRGRDPRRGSGRGGADGSPGTPGGAYRPGPSTAAERCLGAVSHITLAVALASVDLD